MICNYFVIMPAEGVRIECVRGEGVRSVHACTQSEIKYEQRNDEHISNMNNEIERHQIETLNK